MLRIKVNNRSFKCLDNSAIIHIPLKCLYNNDVMFLAGHIPPKNNYLQNIFWVFLKYSKNTNKQSVSTNFVQQFSLISIADLETTRLSA